MDDLTVAEVYELAASIGVEIEGQIRQYGEQSVENLMPKIVHVLEQLETLAERRQRDVTYISELKVEKESLMVEAKREALLRRQLEEKVEFLENVMSDDTLELRTRLSELLEENEAIRSELEDKQNEVLESQSKVHSGDIQVMMKMKATIDMQRDQIRELNLASNKDRSEVEALEEQTNRLIIINERLRQTNYRLQEKLKLSTLERVEAKAQLTTIQQNNDNEFEEVGVVENGGSEESLAKETETHSGGDDSGFEPEFHSTKLDGHFSSSMDGSPTRSDPNRPRYTLSEMQKVLHERNLLKEKVHALEDELSIFRPPSPLETFSTAEIEAARKKVPFRKESGVRKFFGFFYKKEEKPGSIADSGAKEGKICPS